LTETEDEYDINRISSTLKGGALILLLALIYTGLFTADRTTWLMEVTPVIIIVPLLLSTHRRYPLTPPLRLSFHALF
jgi:putative membrane protein